MRRRASFLVLLSVCLLPALAAHAQEQWVVYAPDGANSRIDFPSQPKQTVKEQSVRGGTMKVYMGHLKTGGELSYTVTSAIFPPGPLYKDAQRALTLATRKIVKNLRGKLRTEQSLTVSDAPARRVVIDLPSKQVQVGLIVLKGNELHQAMAVVPAGNEGSADIERFLGSLTLGAAPPPPPPQPAAPTGKGAGTQ